MYYSIPGAGEQYFIKVIYSGSLDLYHWEYMDDDNSTIDFIPLIKRSDSNEMVRPTQGILGLRRKRLAEYFFACPALSTAILSKTVTTTDQIIALYEDQCNVEDQP